MINIIGIGPGNRHYLTPLAQQLINESDWLVGAPRQLALFPDFIGQQHLLDSKLSTLLIWLSAHQQQHVTILASGDPMLYGIGKFLCQQLGRKNVRIIPGISAVQYLFSRLGMDMNELYLTSSHGKVPDFDFILGHRKVAMMTDQTIGPFEIAQQIALRGLQRYLIIGENLSYPNERIIIHPTKIDAKYDLNVVIILQEPWQAHEEIIITDDKYNHC